MINPWKVLGLVMLISVVVGTPMLILGFSIFEEPTPDPGRPSDEDPTPCVFSKDEKVSATLSCSGPHTCVVCLDFGVAMDCRRFDPTRCGRIK